MPWTSRAGSCAAWGLQQPLLSCRLGWLSPSQLGKHSGRAQGLRDCSPSWILSGKELETGLEHTKAAKGLLSTPPWFPPHCSLQLPHHRSRALGHLPLQTPVTACLLWLIL